MRFGVAQRARRPCDLRLRSGLNGHATYDEVARAAVEFEIRIWAAAPLRKGSQNSVSAGGFMGRQRRPNNTSALY